MDRLSMCLHCLARPQQYRKEQWFALILSIICLSVGLWSGYHASLTNRQQALTLYSVEAALALSVGALLWFALTTYPRQTRDV